MIQQRKCQLIAEKCKNRIAYFQHHWGPAIISQERGSQLPLGNNVNTTIPSIAENLSAFGINIYLTPEFTHPVNFCLHKAKNGENISRASSADGPESGQTILG